MTLSPGTRLGPYEIVAPIGAGGMGEVYRAKDTKLDRDVAIKVLPAELAQDPERLARFEREAKLLASLNHPNIAHVYGFESATLEGGASVHFLAMELVPGEDLAERLKRGAIPVDEAIAIAKQIAEALEEAHEKGIVHRDLKPANVKLTPDGKVKVLDFGLAKAWEGPGAASSDLSQSPTLAHTGTAAGLILGTAAYMSPEQARGKPVDKRADIWSFGVVLFEMLTGQKLFPGETVSDVLAAVLTRAPDWKELPRGTPAGVLALLRRCLERDPKKRLHDAADARILLEDAGLGGGVDEDPAEARRAARAGGRAVWVWRIAFLGFGVVAGWAALFLVGGRNAPDRGLASTIRYEVPLPGHSFQGDLALSPNRRTLVFSAADDANGTRSLWVRPLDSLESKKLEGTEDSRFPFWSPDGRELGFFAGGELRVLDTVSGAQRIVTRAGPYTDVRGAAWSSTGVIVFNPRYSGGLQRVSDKGGVVEAASRLDSARGEGTHRIPNFLPDGKHFTFYASAGGGTEPGEVCLGELGSLDHQCLGVSSSSGIPTPSGHLLFVRGKTLLAQRLDAASGKLTGDPIPMGLEFPSNVGTSGQRAFSAGGDALAVHLGAPSRNRLVWVDRAGVEQQTVYDRPADFITYPGLAPDGRRIALCIYRPNATGNIWILDPARNGETPMTREGDNQAAVWSRSGRELAILNFALSGESSVLRADPERPQSARLWKAVPGLTNVVSWTVGDHSVLLDAIGAETASDIFELRDSGELLPLIATRAAELSPEASPDGLWLAYVSDVGGREDVYVAPISGKGNPWKISAAGGNQPRWRPDGRELYYIAPGGRVQAVPITPGSTFTAGAAQTLFSARFEVSGNRAYDVAMDGRRFLVNLSKPSPNAPIVVMLDLGEEIRTLAARLPEAR